MSHLVHRLFPKVETGMCLSMVLTGTLAGLKKKRFRWELYESWGLCLVFFGIFTGSNT